ncbi:MAG: peptidylprolyl isomerase, partial [Bacteroidales bacterium]
DQKVEEITEQYKRAQGEEVSITPEDLEQIRSMAWQRMINDMLMNESCHKLGINVTTEEMNDMYYGKFISPILYNYFTNPKTGVYDRQQVMMLINNFAQLSDQDKSTLSDLEKIVKQERIKEKYYFMVAKSSYLPKAIAANYIEDQMDPSYSRYVALNYMDIPDSKVTIKESDYKTFYEENKYLFKQDVSRAIQYVVFDVSPTPQDMAAIEEQVSKLYADFHTEENLPDFINAVSTVHFDSIYKTHNQIASAWDSVLFNASAGTFFAPRRIGNTFQMAKLMDIQMRPDSVKVSHILIAYKETGSQTKRSKAQAEALADSLKGVLTQNPNMFATLAQQYSEDPSAAQNGGDLSWQKEGLFVKPFNDAILAGSIGSLSVVETQNGFHVLSIAGKTSSVKKVLAGIISVPIEPSSATMKSVFTLANRFLSESHTIAEMDSNGSKKRYRIRADEAVAELAYQLPGVNSAREIIRWAYSKEAKEGKVADKVFEMENQYVIAGLSKIRKEGYIPFEEAKTMPAVEARVKMDKKAEMLIQKVNAIGAYSQIAQVASKLNTVVDSANGITFNAYAYGNRGFEPEVIGHLFGMKKGQISKPIKGNSAVFVVELDNITKTNPAPMIPMVQMQSAQNFQQGITGFVAGALEKMAKIEDNRSFYF